MRIHRLRATAFGPFPDEVTVDFDTLTAAGLFLIHGPTGAGKTSLLDAICFALFADVPGVRDRRGIVSDHAAPTATPSVELEFTCGTRRFSLYRSPAHTRPKKRGTGTIENPATVTLSEHDGAGWRVVSNRNDEAAEVIHDVLGMGKEQFAKVAMLPQGEFAAFLTAKDDDRRALLEKLFDISRFADVEDWLVAQRRESEAAVAAVRSGVDTDLARLGDVVAAVGLVDDPADSGSEHLDDRLAASSDSPEAVRARLDAIGTQLDAQLSEAMVALDVAVSAEALASVRAEHARTAVALRARATSARSTLAALDAVEDDIATVRRTHDDARRASGVRGHLDTVQRATTEAAQHDSRLDLARQQAAALVPAARNAEEDADADDPADLVARLRAHDDTVRELVRLEAQSAARAERVRTHQLAVDHAGTVLETADADRAAAEQRALEVEALLADTLEAAAALEGAAAAAQAARQRLRLAERVVASEVTVGALAEAAATARTAAQDARDHEQDLVARRLGQMAAELAEGLVDGDSCPVCGSHEHPAPAIDADRVTPVELDRARARHATLVLQHQQAESEAASAAALLADGLETLEVASVREVDLGAERAAASEAESRHTDIRRRAGQQEAHERALAGLRAEVARIDASVTEARRDLARATTVAEQELAAEAADQAAVRELEAVHDLCPCTPTTTGGAARGGGTGAGDDDAAEGSPPVSSSARELSRRHDRLVTAATAWLAALEHRETAHTRLAESTAVAVEATTEAGFDSLESATAALVPQAALERLGDRVRDHDRARAAALAVLDDAAVREAESAPEPDLEAVTLAAQQARSALLEAQSAQTRVAAAASSFSTVRTSLVAGLDAAGPTLERHHRVKDLADTFAGGGVNNTLRMRLTSYVLAARLDKVAQLANERLRIMGDGRYRLEHSDRLAARGARSGLGLRVLDQWTGVTRETSTLSGGEAFMASLALALGLADAVREEAGGFDLGTLFVDEGFGTLDDESLEQVISVLDSLREGGRAVGVVSHVGELRSRITSQLAVRKTASGSTVAVSAPGAESAA
ncbi:SMC family ATPase [Knoellia locipacati]|uniref:Nuclease SbcCD subunit C n=1 Tax=Knoellia locipacati TaxID=882824 RepID=A0A512T308_9MICO|nr:AAA family ATPase [Knoellia locipacati]GEQ14584.1 nuclease SbcCD subunit C [Knoellia locipacati]